MTTQELLTLLLAGGSGVAGGVANAQANKQNQNIASQNRLDQNVQQMMAALQNAQQTSQNLQVNHQQMPQTQAQLSPLGQEQGFVQKQRILSALLPQIANFKGATPTDPGVAGAYKPASNVLSGLGSEKVLSSFGDQATASSLADRRKLMAGINPDYQFSSLSNLGLDPSFDQGVNQASIDAGARLKAYEAAQTSLANQQTQLAQQQLVSQQQQQQQQDKKGGGIGGILGNVLKIAAPAAAFIPGVGPLASVGIGAAAGALGNKMSGGSLVGGALQGGLGAGIGEVGQSLAKGQGFNPFNNGAGPVMNNAMTQASLPVGNVPLSGAKPQLNLPSTMNGGLSGLAQGVKQNPANVGGGKVPANIQALLGGVPRTSGIPNVNAVPYQKPSYIGANPQGYVPLPTDPNAEMKAKVNAMLEDQNKNNPMFSNPFFMSLPPVFGLGGGGALSGEASGLPQLPGGAGKALGPGAPPPQGQIGSAMNPRLVGSGKAMPQLPSGPSLKALPQGQYDMGPVAGVGPNQGLLAKQTQSTLAQIQQLLAKLPDGPAKMQAMRKLLMGQ